MVVLIVFDHAFQRRPPRSPSFACPPIAPGEQDVRYGRLCTTSTWALRMGSMRFLALTGARQRTRDLHNDILVAGGSGDRPSHAVRCAFAGSAQSVKPRGYASTLPGIDARPPGLRHPGFRSDVGRPKPSLLPHRPSCSGYPTGTVAFIEARSAKPAYHLARRSLPSRHPRSGKRKSRYPRDTAAAIVPMSRRCSRWSIHAPE